MEAEEVTHFRHTLALGEKKNAASNIVTLSEQYEVVTSETSGFEQLGREPMPSAQQASGRPQFRQEVFQWQPKKTLAQAGRHERKKDGAH